MKINTQKKETTQNMRIKMASVSAVLLLVFAANVGNGYAAAIDNGNLNSQDVNVVWDRDYTDGINVYDNIGERFDYGVDNFSLDGDNLGQDLLDNGNLNADQNFSNDDDELVDGGAYMFDITDLPSANDSDIK